jgi:hypothetical protein
MLEELRERLSLVEIDLSREGEINPEDMQGGAAVIVELVLQCEDSQGCDAFCTEHFHSPGNAIGSVRIGEKWYWLVDREHVDDPQCELHAS